MRRLRIALAVGAIVSLMIAMFSIPFLFQPTPQVQAVTVTFGAAGDFGTGSPIPGSLSTSGLDFFLALGDLSYGGGEQSWCNDFKSSFNDLVIVAGNHDTDETGDGNIGQYVIYCPFTLQTGLTGTYGESYYFDYPAVSPVVRVIMGVPGVGGQVDGDYSSGSSQYNFVSNAISGAQNSGIPWTVFGSHKNCISTGQKSCSIGIDLFNLLLSNDVVILQAHDHNYQRTHQLTCAEENTVIQSCIADTDGQFSKGNGGLLVIQGTGGNGRYGVSFGDSEGGYFASIDDSSYGYTRFTVTETSFQEEYVPVEGTHVDSFLIGPSGPVPLSSSFNFNPSTPVIGQTITFTGSATGGTSPYAFSWTFGDGGTASGAIVTHAYSTNTTFTVTLTVHDNLVATSVTSHTISVVTQPPPPPPPPEGVPLLVGWGGIGVGEVSSFIGGSSVVFPGEQVSKLEQVASLMDSLGYTAMRIMLDNSDLGSAYSTVNWQRTQTVAGYYDMWLVADDHAYLIPDETAWLSFWSGVIGDTTYTKVVWEPRNEPTNSQSQLTQFYQDWIDQARGLGDNRWIIVSITNYQDLRDNAFTTYFPVVTDPIDAVFYNFHEYFFWQYHDFEWSIAEAEAFADLFDQRVTEVEQAYGRPVVITEFGADFGPCVAGCPPDVVLTGSAGYTTITLAYVQRLIDNLDNHASGRVGWIAWTAGDWTDTPGAGDLGALATNGWGRLVTFLPVVPPVGVVGDLNSDCRVDIIDLAIMSLNFGAVGSNVADINGDSIVNIIDLATLGLNYGRTC